MNELDARIQTESMKRAKMEFFWKQQMEYEKLKHENILAEIAAMKEAKITKFDRGDNRGGKKERELS